MVSIALFADPVEVGVPKFYTIPAVFTPTDEVTIYFDMADVGFPEGADLYWWVWQPTEPDHDNFDNSSDFAKLEYLGDNMYKKTIVPVDYFFQRQTKYASREELLTAMEDPELWGEAGYWSRLKDLTGTIQSGVFCVQHNRTEITDFKNSGESMKVFSGQSGQYTDKWTMNKPLSILFNGDIVKIEGKTLNEWAASPGFKFFGVHSGLHGFYTNENEEVIEYDFSDPPAPNVNQQFNVWRPDCIKKVSLRDCGNGVWKWDVMTPQEYYAYNPVNSDEGGIQGTDGYYYLTDMGMTQDGNWAVNTDFVGSFVAQELKFGLVANEWEGANFGFDPIKAGTAEAYPDPSFSIFPTRVSKLDIVTFIRQYNGRTDGALTYTVTAEGRTFSGEMGGNRDKREGSANLLQQLQGVNPSSMHVVITNAKDAVVEEKDIPLLSVDE